VTTVPPPGLAADYQALPGRPAGGYPAVSALLLRHLSDGFPPAVAVEVAATAVAATTVLATTGPAYRAAGGWARLDGPQSVPATASTLFDLASLTKVVATLPLVLLLHQRGQWSIDDPIGRWLPGAPSSPVTISDCLLHISGLVPHRPFYQTCATPAEIRRAVIAELATAVPGQVAYSDLGFMLLGWAAEECAGQPLDVAVHREVLAPLGMTATRYRPDAPLTQIAATEADGDQRLRPGLAWGQVHDGNAFALGGVSGHAGLFGPAADLARYAASYLGRHPLLSPATIALMTARQVGDRVLGWRLDPDALGDWPAGTLWHTGFTGTSLLISPALDTAVVLLANAVHPVRRLDQTAAFRAETHRAIRAAVAVSQPGPAGGAAGGPGSCGGG
jgi:serine-type D-Ala-D-Ala carboxypeptidase